MKGNQYTTRHLLAWMVVLAIPGGVFSRMAHANDKSREAFEWFLRGLLQPLLWAWSMPDRTPEQALPFFFGFCVGCLAAWFGFFCLVAWLMHWADKGARP